ncbi:unnamed protein product [Phaeothamnion confervicola]
METAVSGVALHSLPEQNMIAVLHTEAPLPSATSNEEVELHRLFGGNVDGPESFREMTSQSALDAHLVCSAVKRDGSIKGWARYNPCYWVVAWTPLFIMVLVGYVLHSYFRQGGPVHDKETKLEYNCRIMWIYPMNGYFAIAFVLAAASMVYAVFAGFYKFAGCAVYAMVVWGAVIAGNVAGIQAMATRSAFSIKLFVAANIGFSVGLLLLLVADAFMYNASAYSWSTLLWGGAASILFQAVVAVVYTAMAVAHAQLFYMYDGDDEDNGRRGSARGNLGGNVQSPGGGGGGSGIDSRSTSEASGGNRSIAAGGGGGSGGVESTLGEMLLETGGDAEENGSAPDQRLIRSWHHQSWWWWRVTGRERAALVACFGAVVMLLGVGAAISRMLLWDAL